MAGVVNSCRHCGGSLYDEETAKANCSHCGKPNWDKLKVKSETQKLRDEVAHLHAMLDEHRNSSTITIYTVEEMQDEEGRKWAKVATCFDEDEAESLKGNSNYRRVEALTVFISPPLLRGIKLSSWTALRRYPVDKIIDEQKRLSQIKSKLSSEDFNFLLRHLKGQ